MKVFAVILNYNSYDMTLELVKNFESIASYQLEIRVIVVDNNSSNESASVLEVESKGGRRYMFCRNDKNLGYAAGNNTGIKLGIKQGAEYVFVSNNDIRIPSGDVIKSLVELLQNNRKIGAVSPRIVARDEKRDPPLYIEKPSFWDMTLGIIHCHKKRYDFDESVTCKIYAPRGSFMLLRAEAIEAVDYLDTGTFLYYEEPILAERFAKQGYDCWHCGDVYVIHDHAATISKNIDKEKMRRILCDSYRYYLQNYRMMNRVEVSACLLFRKLALLRR